MKIAIAQINTTIGDFDGNVRLILKNLQKARQQGADLVVFPEMAVCGYPPQDLVEHHSFIDRNQKAIQTIQQETQGLACIVGCVTPNPQDSGRRFQNAAVVLVDGQQVGTYAKRLLPNYDVFDECRHFEPGVHNGVFKVRDSVIGLSICEDMWNDKQFWQSRHYFLDPLQDQAKEGVDILVNIAASPFSMKKGTWRRQLIQSLAEKHGKPVVYVNLVGGNDELIFDGCSLVMNAQGENVVEAKSFEEDFVIVDTQNLVALPPSPAGDEIVEVIQALKVGIQDYLKKCGFQKAVLGLSGGIDSAVTATLAAQALGPENVLGVLMPSMYSSQGSLDDAKFLAKNLNIKTQTIPITDIY
jgi:NAD+ synthase (glutamine-hydrolysing)